MITNLFSVFDPSCGVSIPLNWLAIGLGLGGVFYRFWVIPSGVGWVWGRVVKYLGREIDPLVGRTGRSITLIFLRLAVFIIFNNRLGLLPYVFTSSAHLVFTLSLALPLWSGLYLRGWIANTISILAHLVPLGTPGPLIPFIVVVESLRNIIRPITLAVRLAANMIAGHLLLALMRGAIRLAAPFSGWRIAIRQVALLTLEVAVAFIQAYVFAILCTLYAREV